MRRDSWRKIIKKIGITCLILSMTVCDLKITGTKVQADDAFEASISGFPESYKPYLRKLHASYPNWSFQPYNTGIDFATAVENESIKDRSLTQTNYSDYLQSNADGDYNTVTGAYIPKDGSTWVTASRNAVAYFMDPRNFLDDTFIFMFENLSYDAANQTQAGVEAILAGSFMANTNIAYIDKNRIPHSTNTLYSAKIMEAASQSQVSAYYIASKILQEIGSTGHPTRGGMGASGSVSGDYSTIYTGIYNFYNIGASTSANPILNGLAWAANASNGYGTPWTTPGKSIIGGAKYIGEKFINVGQNTTYLQRFNVTGNKTFEHQYMTNIFGCAAETATTAKAYANLGIKGSQRTFVIPVYTNMPGDATTVQLGKAEKSGTIISNVNLRKGPSTAYGTYTTLNTGDVVTIKESVLTDRSYSTSWLKNPYWCKVDVTKDGANYTGYIAASYVTPEIESSIIAGTTISVPATLSNPGETVYYRSDNPAIATVDTLGNITGVTTGTTTIRAFAASGNFASYTVDVFEKGCILNKKKATINLNKTLKLQATVYPADAADKTVTWVSSNPSVATVSSTGKVKGIAVGNATITATAAAVGGAVGTCEVTVVRPVTGVTLNKNSKTLGVGKTYTLKATVKPKNATIKTVKWKSSDTSVAKVKKGVVTAVAPGTATITATTTNGKKTATCTIKVIPAKMTFKSAKSYNYNTVKLTWNPVSGASGYMIYRKNSAGKYKLIANVAGTATSYKNKKLTTGKTYSYKIRAYTIVGNKKYTSIKSAAISVKPVPKKVKITSVTASGNSRSVITWNRDANVTGYQIYRKSSSQTKYALVKTISKNTTTSYKDKKLAAGQTYYYKMRSYRVVSGKKVYGKYSKVVSLTK